MWLNLLLCTLCAHSWSKSSKIFPKRLKQKYSQLDHIHITSKYLKYKYSQATKLISTLHQYNTSHFNKIYSLQHFTYHPNRNHYNTSPKHTHYNTSHFTKTYSLQHFTHHQNILTTTLHNSPKHIHSNTSHFTKTYSLQHFTLHQNILITTFCTKTSYHNISH